MLLLDRDLVEIKIVEPDADTDSSELELIYNDRAYRLVQAFALSRIQRVRQLLQQLKPAQIERYLVVRERNFYSLWSLVIGGKLAEAQEDRALLSMQASCWFLQEMWLQLEDLLGKKQTQQFGEKLLASTPQVRSQSDFDRLLTIEPLKIQSDPVWMQPDLIDLIDRFAQLIHKKLDRTFVRQLTIEIVENMPQQLQPEIQQLLKL